MFKKSLIFTIVIFFLLQFPFISYGQYNAEPLCNGKYVYFKPQFDDVRFYDNGLFAFKQNQKWGFMNSYGKLLFEPQLKMLTLLPLMGLILEVKKISFIQI